MAFKNKFTTCDDVTEQSIKMFNPFEIHINNSKYQVLGRKLKSERGLPGISKNKAFKKRKRVLLEEYKMKNKSNIFIDKRIGERNSSMTNGDRIMARFATERMRMFYKKETFNLIDTEGLTHKGQLLSEIERFEDTRSDDEEYEKGRHINGTLHGKFVADVHFGGGMLVKSNQDRESLIDELIKESKKRKVERQQNKEETLEATEQLDEIWKTLGKIVTTSKDANDLISQKKNHYDSILHQLKFEPHGQPPKRIVTEEVIEKEDREQKGKVGKESKYVRGKFEINEQSHKNPDDGFENLTYCSTKNGLNDKSEPGHHFHCFEDADADVAENHWEIDTIIEEKMKEEYKEVVGGSALKRPKNLKNEKERNDSLIVKLETETRFETLYTDGEKSEDSIIESSYEEHVMGSLTDLMPLENYTSSIPEVSNNLKVRQETGKMMKFVECIIKLVGKKDMKWKSTPFSISQFSIQKESNREECLQELIDMISNKLKDFDGYSLPLNIVKYLIWTILLCLPSQDIDTAQPTSKLVLMLACKIISENHHIVLKLLCCYILLYDAKISSIIYPEAITVLQTYIQSSTSRSHPEANADSSESLHKNTETQPSDKDKISQDYRLHLEDLDECENGDDRILYCSVVLLSEFVKIYRKNSYSKLMFRSVNTLISSINADVYPLLLKKAIVELKTQLQLLASDHLPTLFKATKKPKSLHQYEPSFHTVMVGKVKRGMPSEKQEAQKLLCKYKREFKGAVRELRRDRDFLAKVKINEKAFSDNERMRKVKEIFSLAASQQGELRRNK